MKGLHAIELFSCAGGMAEGFRRAGLEFTFAFDFDPDACDSYETNLNHRPIQMDVRDLLRLVKAGWRPRPLDLLVADPPCTPWSRAGKRKGTNDQRDMLIQTIGLIDFLRPRAYLVGNVPGLDDADQWPTLQNLFGSQLAAIGYCTDYISLDAAAFGVPQHRIRPFWFGHRGGPCISWPIPTHGDASTIRLDDCKPYATCRDALGHLSEDELGRPVRLRVNDKENFLAHVSDSNSPARTVTTRRSRSSALLINKKHPINKADAPSHTVCAKDRGQQGGYCVEWPWDRPATTVFCDNRIPPPGHHGSNPLSQGGVILSEKARAILQGFPEDWAFTGRTKKSRDSQIGQAMPPPLAEAIARSVLAWFEVTS